MEKNVGYTHKYRQTPRLSASQIGDYLSANATNRRRILTDAKYPPTMLLVRYEDARSAIVEHLTQSHKSHSLATVLEHLRRKADSPGATVFKKQNCGLCIDAIEAFCVSQGEMDLDSVQFRAPRNANCKIHISGVNVSIHLDLLIARKGTRSVGGLVLIFSKTNAVDDIEQRCEAIAMLAHEVLKLQVKSGEVCDPDLCWAVDVFNGRIYRAKARQKQLMRTVGNSCEEVTHLWPSIKPPANYQGPPIAA